MTVPEPDAEMTAIMEDSDLSLVERMRRKQDLMNKRFLAAAAQEEEEAPDSKVRTARTFALPILERCISFLGQSGGFYVVRCRT